MVFFTGIIVKKHENQDYIALVLAHLIMEQVFGGQE